MQKLLGPLQQINPSGPELTTLQVLSKFVVKKKEAFATGAQQFGRAEQANSDATFAKPRLLITSITSHKVWTDSDKINWILCAESRKKLWVKDGDINTSFFHHAIFKSRRRNTIVSIKYENDIMQFMPDQISNTFVNYFRSILLLQMLIMACLFSEPNLPNKIRIIPTPFQMTKRFGKHSRTWSETRHRDQTDSMLNST